MKKDKNLAFPVIEKLFANKYLIDNFDMMPDDITYEVISRYESCPKRLSETCEIPENAYYHMIIDMCTSNQRGRKRAIT